MKKILFTIMLIGLNLSIWGQFNTSGVYDIANNSPAIRFDLGQNFRFNLSGNSSSDTYITAEEGDFSAEIRISPELHDIYKNMSFGIAPGYEIHYGDTDKLSPYFAIEGYFMIGKNSYKQEFWGANDIDNIGHIDKNVTWFHTISRGYNRIGLNLLFGAEYHFTDILYIGFESGFGFGSTIVKNFEFEISDLVAYNLLYGGANEEDSPVAIAGTYDEFDSYYGTTEYLPKNNNRFILSVRMGFTLRTSKNEK